MNEKQLNLFYFCDEYVIKILSFSLIEGSISNHRLQYVLNMHSSDITSMLKKMCVDGYLEAENYGRWTTYKIKPNLATLDPNLATSGGKVVTYKTKVDTSKECVGN